MSSSAGNQLTISSAGSLAKTGSLFSTGTEGTLRFEEGVLSFYDKHKTKLVELTVTEISKVTFGFAYTMKIVTRHDSYIFHPAAVIYTAEDYKSDWLHLIASLYELIPRAEFPFGPYKQRDVNKRWADLFHTYNIPTHLARLHDRAFQKICAIIVLFFLALALIIFLVRLAT